MSEYWGEVTCVGECRDRAIYEELRSDGHERFGVDLGKRYMEMACRKEDDACLHGLERIGCFVCARFAEFVLEERGWCVNR